MQKKSKLQSIFNYTDEASLSKIDHNFTVRKNKQLTAIINSTWKFKFCVKFCTANLHFS